MSHRYSKDAQEAEDILQEAFIKIFKKINTFNFEGSFEGWLKRILVNTALNKIKKNKTLREDSLDENYDVEIEYSESPLDDEYLLSCLNKLSPGYRTVFNMFVIDVYTHKEIAEQLGISEGTSKSQYSKAKSVLKSIINKNELII